MKTIYSAILILSLGAFQLVGAEEMAQEQRETMPTTAAETYKDVEKTLGFVPEFIKAYPEAGVTGAWIKMKSLEMGKSNIDNKNKELISLAVAAQTPCAYCVIFHTASAKANGATEQEIKEAVALAGGVREWSAVLNGMNISEEQFEADVNRIMANMKKEKKMAE